MNENNETEKEFSQLVGNHNAWCESCGQIISIDEESKEKVLRDIENHVDGKKCTEAVGVVISPQREERGGKSGLDETKKIYTKDKELSGYSTGKQKKEDLKDVLSEIEEQWMDSKVIYNNIKAREGKTPSKRTIRRWINELNKDGYVNIRGETRNREILPLIDKE